MTISLARQWSPLLPISIAVGLVLTIVSVWLLSNRKLTTSILSVVAAFICAGFVLALIDSRPIASNRIARLQDEEIIAPGEPVELTGVVSGEPETAPQSFYLTLKAERIRIKGVERDATGTVFLLAPVREQREEEEYEALQLRHGARVRVMTTLDREENFRNPGVAPFTEYLERKGFDATGVIKSPLLIERLDDERVFLPLAWLYEWRRRLEREFGSKFSTETAGVLDAALLGNRYNVSHASADRFRAGGTFHVLVIAGLHISFVAGVVFLLVRWMTRRRLLQFICAVHVRLGLCNRRRCARAGGARGVDVHARGLCSIVSRRTRSLNAIGAAALALLSCWPGDLFDPAFQMTFYPGSDRVKDRH